MNVAIVTGAGSGIGRASALRFAAGGFHGCFAGRRGVRCGDACCRSGRGGRLLRGWAVVLEIELSEGAMMACSPADLAEFARLRILETEFFASDDRFDRRPPTEAETKPAPLPVNPFHSPYDLGRFDPGISYSIACVKSNFYTPLSFR